MKTIHLQGIGKREASFASEIKAGDTLIWNFGESERVLSINKETTSVIWILLQSITGETRTIKMLKSRLVAIKN